MKAHIQRTVGLAMASVVGLLMMGCESTVSIVPNPDATLRKPPAAFAADASKRQYELDAPKESDKQFRADYALVLRQIDLANVSSSDCQNVEVWINEQYVVYCPEFSGKTDKTLKFTMFYDQHGHRFDTQGGKNPIKILEVYRDGTMYEVINHVAD
jgi:hypothetical protein